MSIVKLSGVADTNVEKNWNELSGTVKGILPTPSMGPKPRVNPISPW
jgi:hypothetical protein